MTKLDNFIELIVQRRVERAVLVSDQPFQLFANGQVTGGVFVTHAQLRQVLEEVTPYHLHPQLNGGSFQFQYQSPFGVFDVNVQALLDKIQATISPSRLQSAAFPTTAPLPATIAPAGNQSYHPTAAQPVHCQQCGTGNLAGASFCSGCGRSFTMPLNYSPSYMPTGGFVAPQQQQPIVNVTTTVTQKGSSGGWWAALLLLLFGSPLGCIAIPVALVLLVVVFYIGAIALIFAPMIVAIISAVVVWRHQAILPQRKTYIIAGILGGGLLIQFLLLGGIL